MTLNVQNVQRWPTHKPAVACGSLSQSCQWLSPVTQTKLTKVDFKTRELVWLLLQLLLRPQHCPQT